MQKRIEVPLGSATFLPESHLQEAITWSPPYNRFVKNVTAPTLTLHVPDGKGPFPAVLICPGGGYGGVSFDKEGHHVADWLSARGVVGAVLKYRMPRPPAEGLPLPVIDFFQALSYLNDEPEVDSSRVTFMGFSAGGHLAGLCAMRFHNLAERIGFGGPAPAAVALLYPVVAMKEGYAHGCSRANLLGLDADPEELAFYSVEKGVGVSSPPLFLAHAADDKGVPIENSAALEAGYREHGRPVEFLTYAEGGHGFGMAPGREPLCGWVPAFGDWLDRINRQ